MVPFGATDVVLVVRVDEIVYLLVVVDAALDELKRVLPYDDVIFEILSRRLL